MGVHIRELHGLRPAARAPRRPLVALNGSPTTLLERSRVGQVLGEWQTQELALAQRYPECKDLSAEELEDLYQETVMVLLKRDYKSEDHLRHALHQGLKKRALHFHRDERRRVEILAESREDLPAAAIGGEAPERAALIHEDRLVVAEFLAELTELEQRVFWLSAEGMSYRAIATAEGLSVNEARNASRSAERKRERFQLLYDTGRLCGFRGATIRALIDGQQTSEELATRACAHLEHCAHCRAEHRTNAKRLRNRFEGQAAVLLPALGARLGRLGSLDLRARMLAHRLLSGRLGGLGGLRERGSGLVLGGSAAAKLAAGAATVALLAGGAVGATHVLEGGPAHHHATAPPQSSSGQAPVTSTSALSSTALLSAAPLPAQREAAKTARATPPQRQSPGHAVAVPQSKPKRQAQPRKEPTGFAYLGVPAATESQAPSAEEAEETPAEDAVSPAAEAGESQSGGGPFSP